MAKDELNPLECEECGHVSGAPATARIHANTHSSEEPEVKEKPKKTRKKAAK